MRLEWRDMELFLAIAETGSLSAAAKQLAVGQPTVSRRLAELEYRVGAQLFTRHLAGVTLTSAGERMLPPARHMAEWASEVERAADVGTSSGPRGTVRVTAPPGVAFDFLAPVAAMVRECFPEIRIEALSAVERLDLARGEADLALRFQRAVSPELVTLGSFAVPTRVMVSSAYAGRLPKRPTLADLDWISWAPPYEDVPPAPQLRALVPDFKPVFTSDNFLVQWRACEAGLGALILGSLRHRHSLPSSLVPLHIDLGPHGESLLHIVCAKSAMAVPRVQAVGDLLLRELSRKARR